MTERGSATAPPGGAVEITALIPVFNEAENLAPLLDKLTADLRALGKTCATSWDSVPCATIRPRLMMMTPSQTMETSGRIWVERITVCCPASERISARISAICLGSRPIVGSSRMSTSGSPSSAWANPTRWR